MINITKANPPTKPTINLDKSDPEAIRKAKPMRKPLRNMHIMANQIQRLENKKAVNMPTSARINAIGKKRNVSSLILWIPYIIQLYHG